MLEPAKVKLFKTHLQSHDCLVQRLEAKFLSGGHVSPKGANHGGNEEAEQLLPAVKVAVWVWVAMLDKVVHAPPWERTEFG